MAFSGWCIGCIGCCHSAATTHCNFGNGIVSAQHTCTTFGRIFASNNSNICHAANGHLPRIPTAECSSKAKNFQRTSQKPETAAQHAGEQQQPAFPRRRGVSSSRAHALGPHRSTGPAQATAGECRARQPPPLCSVCCAQPRGLGGPAAAARRCCWCITRQTAPGRHWLAATPATRCSKAPLLQCCRPAPAFCHPCLLKALHSARRRRAT